MQLKVTVWKSVCISFMVIKGISITCGYGIVCMIIFPPVRCARALLGNFQMRDCSRSRLCVVHGKCSFGSFLRACLDIELFAEGPISKLWKMLQGRTSFMCKVQKLLFIYHETAIIAFSSEQEGSEKACRESIQLCAALQSSIPVFPS